VPCLAQQDPGIASLNDLKTRLSKIILIVTMFDEVLNMKISSLFYLLYLGDGAIALIGASLSLTREAENHGCPT
jgi:hypothetical protein